MVPAKGGSTALTASNTAAIESRAAGGCGTPGNPALAGLPLVAFALFLATRTRRTAIHARSPRR
jgi:MYXO-CTERM domain-containing protein